MAQEKLDKMKNWFGDVKQKFNYRITMEGILKQARESLQYFLNSKTIPIEQKISDKLMNDAYGIIFLTELKVGALAGGKIGTGIIISRIEDKEDEWSAPIAIGTGGFSLGFQAGVSKVDHIILLPSPNHLKTFLGKGQLQIKGNAEVAVANYGRDANVGVGVSDKGDAAPIMSYSFGAKGLYGGVSVDGGVLVPRNQCNATFYGKNIELSQIITGEIEAPTLNEDYKQIIQFLDNNTKINGTHTMNAEDLNGNKGYEPPVNQWNQGNDIVGESNEYDQFHSKI